MESFFICKRFIEWGLINIGDISIRVFKKIHITLSGNNIGKNSSKTRRKQNDNRSWVQEGTPKTAMGLENKGEKTVAITSCSTCYGNSGGYKGKL
jgi:hypothetical protein